MHKGLLAVVVLAVAASGGCSAKKTVVRTTTTVAAASKPTTTASAPPTPSTTAGRPAELPISVSAPLSSTGQDPSVMLPSSCTLVSGTVTATGTFRGGPVPETYVRYGDVVELYAYTSPVAADGGQTFQVANLVMEKPFVIGASGPWT